MNRVLSINAEEPHRHECNPASQNGLSKRSGYRHSSTPALMPACRRHVRHAPAATPCAAAPCARTCWRWKLKSPPAANHPRRHARQRAARAAIIRAPDGGQRGTLGITRSDGAPVRALPEAVSAAICSFPSIEAAVRPPSQIISSSACRCAHGNSSTTTRAHGQRHSKLTCARNPLLLMGFHGSPASVKDRPRWVQGTSPANLAAMPLNGPAHPETRGCGPRGTTPALPAVPKPPRLPRHQHRPCVPISRHSRLPAQIGGQAEMTSRHPLLPGGPCGRRQLPLRLPHGQTSP